MIIFFY